MKFCYFQYFTTYKSDFPREITFTRIAVGGTCCPLHNFYSDIKTLANLNNKFDKLYNLYNLNYKLKLGDHHQKYSIWTFKGGLIITIYLTITQNLNGTDTLLTLFY